MTMFRIKNKKIIWISAIALAGGLIFWMTRGGDEAEYEFMVVERGELVQEVSVTGKIRPVQSVDLQFENSGRIAAINYKVGQKVNAGATIASLENQELQAEVTSARADLDKTVRSFNSLGDPSIYSSLRVELENAQTSLAQITGKADSDLASKYNTAFNALREAMTQIDTSSVVLEYLRKTYFEAKEPWNSVTVQYQASVDSGVDGVLAVLPSINQSGTEVTPELYGKIDLALQKALAVCQSLRSAFTYLQGEAQNNSYLISSTTDRSSLNTEAAAISSDTTEISSAIQGIVDQKVTNSKNISDAKAKLTSAKAAFPTIEDVTQMEAALLLAQSQLRKSIIVAPFTGTIGKIEVERGQTVNSSTVILSLVSAADYQIEANITEIDIGKVKVGDPAVLTLDAYGPQVVLNAKVSSVDTSATIIEGVTTYKTTFDFDGPIGQDIRPNMTANIDIQTDRKDNVISIPQRAVITRNGAKLVRVQKGELVEEVMVETGLSGKDGFVEIVSGLNEGDRIVTFVND